MSIKFKLLAGFGLVLLLLAIITGVFDYALSQCINGYANLYSGEVKISTEATNIQFSMLQCRRNEKDFLQRKDMKYLELFNNNLNTLNTSSAAVITIATERNYDKITILCQDIIEKSVGYREAFTSITNSIEAKGLDHKSGLQGEFRSAAHELATEIEKRDIDMVYISFLDVRRYEKDYQRTHDSKYLEKWDRAISIYVDALDSSTCCINSKKNQKEGLAKYLEARKTYLAAIKKNDPNATELYKAVRNSEAAGKISKAISNSYVSGCMSTLLNIRKNEKDYLLRGDEKYAQATLKSVDKLKKAYKDSAISQENKDIVYKLCDNYISTFNKLVEEDRIIAKELSTLTEEAHEIESLVAEVHKKIAPLIDSSQEETNYAATNLAHLAIALSISAIILGIIFSVLILKSILKPILDVVNFADFLQQGDLEVTLREGNDELGIMGKALNNLSSQMKDRAEIASIIANGDLRVDVAVISEKDLLGQSLETMVKNLNDILTEVTIATTQVSTAAAEISSASEALSQGSTESASSLEEITASMTEMSSRTNSNATHAKEANELASIAEEAANTGQNKMEQMTASMEQISNNAIMTQKVIKTIDDIAFQTNLLALNAAVEAARAGIHGKGFAVVAEEVRNLAARSAKAAAETEELIDNSNRQIQDGVSISSQTAESLVEIAENVSKTRQLVGEIDLSSSEEATGIYQINTGLQQVDTVTQQNTACAEETASAAEELSSQATMLQHLVSRFKLKNQSGISSKTIYKHNTMNNSTTTLLSASLVNPSEQIPLDDSEFGKF